MSRLQEPAQYPIKIDLPHGVQMLIPASVAALVHVHTTEAMDVLSRISNSFIQGFTIEITQQDCAVLAHEITAFAAMSRTLAGMVYEAETDAGGANA